MKRCPQCNRVETDEALSFCRTDGTPLVNDSAGLGSEAATDQHAVTQSEIETSILPHRTDANANRSTGPTTVLPTAATSGATHDLAQRRRSPLVIAFAVILVAAASLGGYFYFKNKTNSAIQSIAVMPFINESGNAEVDYLSDGMTDTLINSLSNIPNLNVKARSSVFRYKGKDLDPKKIASELNVQAILTGRVAQRGEQLTLNLELIDAATENVLWGNKYERNSDDLISLQNEVTRDVSNKLKWKMSGFNEAKVARNYTENTEAYQLYLKGLFYWNKRTPEALQKSIEYYSQAMEKDPNYALAYAGMASTYVLLPQYSINVPRAYMPKAKAMARKALDVDDSLAEAHAALAYALLTYDRNYEESSKEFKRAMEVNPNYATAYQWYADGYLTASGRLDDALVYIKKAQELDPFSMVINAQVGLAHLYARDYDKAIEQYRKTVDLDPNWYLGHWFLGIAYQAKGNLNEAGAEYHKANELNGDPYVLAHIANVSAALGRRDEALKMIDRMKQIGSQRYVPAYAFAIAYIGLGDKEEALNWLEKAEEDREWDILHLKVEPFFDGLRNEPRYHKIVEKVGLL